MRRTFLKGAASGLALLIVQRAQRAEAHQPAGYDGLRFLNPDQARTVEAIAARIWPGDAKDPGAREAGAMYYIDGALAGPYARHQDEYRRGLERLDVYAQHRFHQAFADLKDVDQDRILTDMEKDKAQGFPHASDFFWLVRNHTMEGVFCDPVHGGNRDFVGWKAVGYPGAYYLFTEDEQLSTKPLNKPFQSVADL